LGDTFQEWAEIRFIQPISKDLKEFEEPDQAEFLDEKGQLKYELAIELENYKVRAINHNNVNLYFVQKGTVHHPEIFEAVIKGFHIDTSDFVINTAHDKSHMEGHYNR
jgi:hypothetical protein